MNFQRPFEPLSNRGILGAQPIGANFPGRAAPAAPVPLAAPTTQIPLKMLMKHKTMEHFSTSHKGMIIIYFLYLDNICLVWCGGHLAYHCFLCPFMVPGWVGWHMGQYACGGDCTNHWLDHIQHHHQCVNKNSWNPIN